MNRVDYHRSWYFFFGGVSGAVVHAAVLFMERARKVSRNVAGRFESFSFAVDTGRGAHAGKASLMGGLVGAFEAVVFGKVVAGAERTDDGSLGSATAIGGVAEGVADVALTNKRERVKESYDAWSAEHENWIRGKTTETRTVFVKESEEHGGLKFFSL